MSLGMTRWTVIACFSFFLGCGHHGGSGGPDGNGDDDGDGGTTDAEMCTGICTDAPPFNGMCTPGGPQCSNCIDDDNDGMIDGQDVECTGSLDNDESSFSTGIPGDNKDTVNQDCFFDGNSGAGDDRCNIHVCCLLGAHTKAECPYGANQYNPDDCPPPIGTHALSPDCIANCGHLTPPGCDCFGCCTECVPGSNPAECYDIEINPATATMCDASTIADPMKCPRCTKVTSCGNTTCGGDTCVLCPGQDPSSLPPTCQGSACPTGETVCSGGQTCPSGTYCSNGCCIGVIQ